MNRRDFIEWTFQDRHRRPAEADRHRRFPGFLAGRAAAQTDIPPFINPAWFANHVFHWNGMRPGAAGGGT